jgi:hypothetical protein
MKNFHVNPDFESLTDHAFFYTQKGVSKTGEHRTPPYRGRRKFSHYVEAIVSEGTNGRTRFIRKDFQEVLEEEIDFWMATRRVQDGESKARLWLELGRILGITDRQVKRYYTGETTLPADKILPLCRHLGSIRLVKHLAQSLDPEWPNGGAPEDYVTELIDAVEDFSKKAALAVESLYGTPTYKEFRELKAASRAVRDQIQRFEWLYRQILDEERDSRQRKARQARREAEAEEIPEEVEE